MANRRQDRLLPAPTPERDRAPTRAPDEDAAGLPAERRLAALVRALRGDDAGLLALLAGTPAPGRPATRVVFIRELGAAHAAALFTNAFGDGFAGLAPPPVEQVTAATAARLTGSRAR